MKEQAKKIINKVVLYSFSILSLVFFSLVFKINPLPSFLFFFIFVYLIIINFRKARKAALLHLGILFIVGLAITIFFRRFPALSPYLIPLPAIAMLSAILFSDLEIVFLLSLCLSVFAGFIFHADICLMSIMLLGSLTGAFFVYRARQHYKIIQSGIFVSVVMVFSLLAVSERRMSATAFFSSPDSISAAINGIFSAFIVAGSLPIFEFIFNAMTNISLLELSDFNHPLLKRLVLEAPGTYHHSLIVGNLAETAAEAINANALLARVGAYYHDIGKLEKPEYFSENQNKQLSRHEQLKAPMSKLVIVNHVREGLLLAKKHKLNSAITEFIEQHHGTSLVFYFYRRALEETKKNEDVNEEIFRYTGPKPQTKEAAIVLLADSVEAACRAQDAPNAQRIEEVVHTVINNKFIDGQLDECDLTLLDLNKIAKTFIRILSAIYHSRIEYPEMKSDNSNK